jgi:biotin-(acetyl-CoA carboxylase) ligase
MNDFEAPLTEPVFPPLFAAMAVQGAVDPFEKARMQAVMGCDAGLVVHNVQADRLRAAVVLAPEVPLAQAVSMLPLAGVGFQNALGALAPPEVAVHVEWSGAIRLNGALCGGLRIAASADDPAAEPDWLVLGLDLPLMDVADDPGATPDQTTLYGEGCMDVHPIRLLEAWIRHMLVWINSWSDEGARALHDEWRGIAHGIGDPVTHGDLSGTFLGVDEDFGMLLRDSDTTHLIPLVTLLEA